MTDTTNVQASTERNGGGGPSREPSDPSRPGDTREQPVNRKLPRLVIAIVVAAAVAAIVALLLWWLHARNYESTDDAYIDTNITQVASRGSGEVTAIYVNDNDYVRAGQLLVQLDDSAAQAVLLQAEAARDQALATIAQAKSQIGVATAQVSLARSNTEGPAAQAANAQRDYDRYLKVHASQPAAVAQQQLDQARTTASNNTASLNAANKQVSVSVAQLDSDRTQLDAGKAQLKNAAAQIAQAKVQIAYARVVASSDGHVSHRNIAIGNYAQPGQNLMSIVPAQLWVTANFKETQIQHIHEGQQVDLKIDAYPGVDFVGHIQSIQFGAGQSFALLPSQNASGNFVKVVQRVPVKILIDRPNDRRYVLGPGMSVVPRVRIG